MYFLLKNWKIWLIIFSCWIIVGLLPNGMYYLRGVYEGRDRDFWRVLFGCVAAYGLWGILSPPLVLLCQKYPLDTSSRKRNLWIYFPAFLVFALLHLGACTFVTIVSCTENEVRPPLFDTFRQLIFIYFHTEVVAFGVVGGAFHALRYYRRIKERELEAAKTALSAAQLESTLKQAQLNALKSQLQPHFLFNALNTISVLMSEDVETANKMLIELSELLRMSLRNDTNEIALKEEIEFLETYLRIEQMRFHDRLKIAINIEPATLDARVPHLILQPIVENAIKHGVSAKKGAGEVEIKVTRHSEILELSVRDNGFGFHQTTGKRPGNGIGLKNTRHRLERMYPNSHEIQITEAPGSGTIVVIQIPYLPVSLN